MAHHGNTPAAWTSVAVAMLGFVIGSLALMRDPISQTWLIVGLVVAAAALPLFLVLARTSLHSSDH